MIEFDEASAILKKEILKSENFESFLSIIRTKRENKEFKERESSAAFKFTYYNDKGSPFPKCWYDTHKNNPDLEYTAKFFLYPEKTKLSDFFEKIELVPTDKGGKGSYISYYGHRDREENPHREVLKKFDVGHVDGKFYGLYGERKISTEDHPYGVFHGGSYELIKWDSGTLLLQRDSRLIGTRFLALIHDIDIVPEFKK